MPEAFGGEGCAFPWLRQVGLRVQLPLVISYGSQQQEEQEAGPPALWEAPCDLILCKSDDNVFKMNLSDYLTIAFIYLGCNMTETAMTVSWK